MRYGIACGGAQAPADRCSRRSTLEAGIRCAFDVRATAAVKVLMGNP